MATNKNALIRYKVLDNCFRNAGKRYFIANLIEQCEKVLLEIDSNSNGISRRQILEDIAFMESKDGWKIALLRHRDGKRVYYRYADTSFSINNMPLNEVEINQLRSVADILSQFKGMPQFEWLHELVPKLKQGMGVNDALTTIIDFDTNKYLKGIDRLGALHNAIFYEKILQVSYQPYESTTPSDVIMHPYFLKQYNSRWFLFGYNPEKERHNWNMAIDRIVDIKEVKGKYLKNKRIDWQDYFEDIIGVTKPDDADLENIVLHFFGKTGKYMESKPLHGSQKLKWLNENTLEVRLSLLVNYELERLILSYADSVKVIQPKSLKTRIIRRLENAISGYS